MRTRGTSIFLSYRRADTGGYAGRLADCLEQYFGAGSVFHDVETIQPGADFVKSIERALDSSSVVLVLIGDTWIDARDASGTRLLDRDDDFVRIEAATALTRGIPVVPLLFEGARMPSSADLPDNLKRLARQQALELSDSRWDYDFQRLVDAIRRFMPPRASSAPRRNLLLGLAAGAVAIGIGAALLYDRPSAVPDLTGRWDLPTGSFWMIVQDGARFTIEETHYQSKEVWKRGSGSIEDGGIRFTLELVFDRRPPESGVLRLSTDARTLAGEAARADSPRPSPIVLTRH
jgi:hypothetical protein